MSEHDAHNDNSTLAPDAPDDPLTGHNYDGIQEYDNPTPAWWTWLFIVSVVFACLYMALNLMALGGLSPEAEYDRALVANLEKKFGEIGELQPDAATILEYAEDEEWVAFGERVYKSWCAQCHGADGSGGSSAPSLTDDHYIHITKVEDIADVVINGRGGAMPAWGTKFHPNEVVLVSSYIASIRGTNMQGKSPEGEVPPPWNAGDQTPAEDDAP